ncbi:MAG: hypothetical protein KCHDKBKB_00015 [Elusimicrobia bacterium]|nr:hypothetical protein [Elusimicrobiota bacterium]
MAILEFSKPSQPLWVFLSIGALVFSLGLGIFVGPWGIFVASGLGAGFAIAGLYRQKQVLLYYLMGVHILLLIVGMVLNSLFLTPLSNDSLQMPRLNQTYEDPLGLFTARVPQGWQTETLHSKTEAAVRLQPANREQYMGVSEVTIRVRELENPTAHPVDFLNKLAQTLSVKPKKESLFTFSTEPTTLLDGKKGVWSRLFIKRFWIPLYQRALYGIKNTRFLCTVSASGIESHSTLTEVLCLGLYETIQIIEINKKQKTN